MSDADRTKWDERYRSGAYGTRRNPSAILLEWIDRVPPGRALDVACGSGRNALFLARHGFGVDAVDISAAALSVGRDAASAAGLEVHWIEHDLDNPIVLEPGYALVLAVRFVNLPRIRELAGYLAPGGLLICEEHLISDAEVIGPSNPAYRLRPGELREVAAGLRLRHYAEGLFEDPDGRPAALARLVAERPLNDGDG
jgi:SAM-dependent methyltransferase